jgi:uncharacterized protein (TIGR00251 family)
MSGLSDAITDHAEGTVLAIVVAPRSSKTGVDRVEANAVRIRVAAPPVDGAANTALLRYLAEVFDRPKSSVRLISGATGKRKRVLIEGRSPADVAARIQRLLAPASAKRS